MCANIGCFDIWTFGPYGATNVESTLDGDCLSCAATAMLSSVFFSSMAVAGNDVVVVCGSMEEWCGRSVPNSFMADQQSMWKK